MSSTIESVGENVPSSEGKPEPLSLSEKFDEALAARDNNPMNIPVDKRTVSDHWINVGNIMKQLAASPATAEQRQQASAYVKHVIDGINALIQQKQVSVDRVSSRQTSIGRKIATHIPFTREWGKRNALNEKILDLQRIIGRVQSDVSRFNSSTTVLNDGVSVPTETLIRGKVSASVQGDDVTRMTDKAAVDAVTGAVVGPALGIKSADAATLNVVGGLLADIFGDATK